MDAERVREVMAGHVRKGHLPGAAWLVSRDGETYADAVGVTAVGGDVPVDERTLWRLTSMTKPIAAVAALRLVDAGVFGLDDPVDPWLPELAGRRVLRALDGPLDDTVPAARPITVRDLLTYRMGFGLLLADPAAYPIAQAAEERGLALGPPVPVMLTPDEWLARLGELPLMAQPGERWLYNGSPRTLGFLIARAAGKPLADALRDGVLGPLGMADTSFTAAPDDLGRFATAYDVTPDGGLRTVDGPDGAFTVADRLPDAAGGLVSTLADYGRFAAAMAARGAYPGGRLLSEDTFARLVTDQLTPEQRSGGHYLPGFGGPYGWGLGLAVLAEPHGPMAAGRFGWDGGYGSSWYADPAAGVSAVLMTQRVDGIPGPERPDIRADFWAAVYA